MKTYVYLWSYIGELFLNKIFLDEICREKQNTHFMLHNFVSENRSIYDITWKNTVQPDEQQTTVL